MKKWYMTSEAWMSIIPAVFGILVTTGVLTPDKASELSKNIMAIVGAIMAIVPAVVYSNNRTELKKSVVDAMAYAPAPVDTDTVKAASAEHPVLARLRAAGI